MAASEIVKAAEEALARAATLRLEASRLLAEAEVIEKVARDTAIEQLGPELGEAALALAGWSLDGSAPARAAASAAAPAARPARAASEPRNEPPAEPPMTVKPAGNLSREEDAPLPHRRQDAAQRDGFYGVEVPPSRTPEAEDIVLHAKAQAAQGKKANPWGSDRGKNAWRKALFRAAFETFSKEAPPPKPVPVEETGPAAHPVPELRQSFRDPVAAELEDLDVEESSATHSADADGEQAGLGLPDDGDIEDDSDIEDNLNGGEEDEAALAALVGEADDKAWISDPLDDLEEEVLPPPSSQAPPRGYAEREEPQEPSAPPLPGPAREAEPAPAAQQPPARPAVAATPVHTPIPVDPSRRPGTGQALQRPAFPPPGPGASPRPAVPSRPPAPPAFLRR